jgi:hypothetical protein
MDADGSTSIRLLEIGGKIMVKGALYDVVSYQLVRVKQDERDSTTTRT